MPWKKIYELLMATTLTVNQQPVVRIFEQREVIFDSEGFLNDFDDWTVDMCKVLAKECGLVVFSCKHWRVIHFLRRFYSVNGRAPLNSQIKKGTAMSLLELEAIFPSGIKNGAKRLAGLPNPKTCD